MKFVRILLLFAVFSAASGIAASTGSDLVLEAVVSPKYGHVQKRVGDAEMISPIIEAYEVVPVIRNTGKKRINIATRGGIYTYAAQNVMFEIATRAVHGKPLKISPFEYGQVTLAEGEMAALPPIRFSVEDLRKNYILSYAVDDGIGDQLGCWTGVLNTAFGRPEQR